MNIAEIVNKLTAAGYSAKASKDGSNAVISCGENGFFRVYPGDAPRIADHSTFSRVKSRHVLAEIQQALA